MIEIPKRKQNHFYVFNKKEHKYDDVKYISQQMIAEGYTQIIPKCGIKKMINHFSITLSFLPDHLWSKLRKNEKLNCDDVYLPVKDGITRYFIVETNQDDTMINLYNELKKINPNSQMIKEYVEDLDESQYISWLVLRAKYFLEHNHFYYSEPVNDFEKTEDQVRFILSK